MKAPRWKKAAAIGSIALCGIAGVAWAGLAYWYRIPACVEDFDTYAPFGFRRTKVWFHEGRILVIHDPHSGRHPGMVIGHYFQNGNRVQIDFIDGDDSGTYVVDPIGLIGPQYKGQTARYMLFDSRSSRVRLFRWSRPFRKGAEEWWWKSRDFLSGPFR